MLKTESIEKIRNIVINPSDLEMGMDMEYREPMTLGEIIDDPETSLTWMLIICSKLWTDDVLSYWQSSASANDITWLVSKRPEFRTEETMSILCDKVETTADINNVLACRVVSLDIFNKVRNRLTSTQLSEFMLLLPELQTKTMLNDLMSLNPSYHEVAVIAANCDFYDKEEMEVFLKSRPHDRNDVATWLGKGDFFSTPEMLEYWKSLSPNPCDVYDVLLHKEGYRTKVMAEYYLSRKPPLSHVLAAADSDLDQEVKDILLQWFWEQKPSDEVIVRKAVSMINLGFTEEYLDANPDIHSLYYTFVITGNREVFRRLVRYENLFLEEFIARKDSYSEEFKRRVLKDENLPNRVYVQDLIGVRLSLDIPDITVTVNDFDYKQDFPEMFEDEQFKFAREPFWNKFNPIELLVESVSVRDRAEKMAKLFKSLYAVRTDECVKYFLSLSPSQYDLSTVLRRKRVWFNRDVLFKRIFEVTTDIEVAWNLLYSYRTQEMLEFFKSLCWPGRSCSRRVAHLMAFVDEYYTSEMLEFLKTLKPGYGDLLNLMRQRVKGKEIDGLNKEVTDFWLSLDPPADFVKSCITT